MALNSILQGYNVEVGHILGEKNPADSLSRQLISDALVRKGSVKDANEEYVMQLRVPDNATNDQIHQHYTNYSIQIFNQFRALKATVSALKAILRHYMEIKPQVRSILRTSLQLSHLVQCLNCSWTLLSLILYILY